jgi:inosine-uridine nucleoside N-ribohydrolase
VHTSLTGQLTIVAIGPLTNIAQALHLDNELSGKLKSVYIMGGNVYGIGNVEQTTAEMNFYCDPEAAQHVLTKMIECPADICVIQ